MGQHHQRRPAPSNLSSTPAGADEGAKSAAVAEEMEDSDAGCRHVPGNDCEHVSLGDCIRKRRGGKQLIPTGLVVNWEGCEVFNSTRSNSKV